MSAQLAVYFALAGAIIGSFLNVCIDRLPSRKSLASPPSHCDACQHRLGILDLIPVFSYLILRGRCRYCGARIPFRVLWVEVSSGILFLLAFWQYGLTAQFGVAAFWCCVLLVIIFIDWENQLILNIITYPAIVIAIVILSVHTYVPGANLLPPQATLINGLVSSAVLFVFFLLIILIRPGAMGMGDAKLVALIGLVSGFPLVVFSMLIGVVLGGIVAVVLLATKKKGRKDVIPYGAFLGIGPIFALIFATHIINWYLPFFQ
jgi:leader peptidase (prepilin peptidase) / N-methyltransferase